MGTGEKTFGDRETLRGVTDGAAWQAAEGLTIGDLETLRDEGVLLAGRYRVVRRLGEGGMGSVWLAEDAKLDGRKVAVKMLPAVLAGKKGAYRQVKAEAMVAMKLSHPNIATVRAFEEDEGGNPFLVMDYIEGEGLDDILAERGPLGEEETRRLLGPVAAALDYAHSQGVVHRDVKPGNVMVRKDGVPFVLDFGIAREVQETMTRVTGKLSSGTLLYMSPEQLRGKGPKAAQDVYSFAAMAYECLAGRPPFFRGAIEDQIKNEPPEELPGSVGEGLRKGVMAGLAKEPGGRPGSCAGVLGRSDLGRGNIESRFADIESRGAGNEKKRGGRSARPEGPPHQGGDVGGDVFLLKVQLGNALREAEQGTDATAEEKAELERIREVFVAGEEAMNSGESTAAESLFLKGEAKMENWWKDLEARRQRERAEEVARVALAPKCAKERMARCRVIIKRAATIAGCVALAWALMWGIGVVGRSMANSRTRKAVAGMGQGTRVGEEKTIPIGWSSQMAFVWCPPGSFMMGSPAGEEGRFDDETQHQVTLSEGFWMAKTEVTQKQWKSVMGSNPSRFKGDYLPVERVGWKDCQEFCRKTGLALPTEAQWEYACRAGTTGEYGRTGQLGEMEWFGERVILGHTHPVGQKKPNGWGLYDMHGNVREWCADWYTADLGTRAVMDPQGPSTGSFRVRRGGSFEAPARYCRSAYRGLEALDCVLGLRVVLRPVQ